MTDTASHNPVRELDRRTSDGIDVRLMWNSLTDQVLLAVYDARTEESFELPVDRGVALEAFHHPYAHVSATNGRAAAHRARRGIA